MALRPRLSPGVPLSRDGRPEIGSGTAAGKHTLVQGTLDPAFMTPHAPEAYFAEDAAALDQPPLERARRRGVIQPRTSEAASPRHLVRELHRSRRRHTTRCRRSRFRALTSVTSVCARLRQAELALLNRWQQAANLLEECSRPNGLASTGPGSVRSAFTPEINSTEGRELRTARWSASSKPSI